MYPSERDILNKMLAHEQHAAKTGGPTVYTAVRGRLAATLGHKRGWIKYAECTMDVGGFPLVIKGYVLTVYGKECLAKENR